MLSQAHSTNHWRNWWATPLAGVLGGYLASQVGWPLPWMIGSMLGVIALRCAGALSTEMPGGRQSGQLIVASGIGLHFTSEVLSQVYSHLVLVIIGAFATLALSLIGIAILRRSGLDRATAFFASMPGGASDMVTLAAPLGANSAQVAAAHSLRMLLVVLLIPALFTLSLPTVAPRAPVLVNWPWLIGLLVGGYLMARLWRRLRQPNPWMLGPLTLCVVASVSFDLHQGLPASVGHLGQWLIGCGLGCHFDRAFFRKAPGFLLRVLLFALLAMGCAVLLGLALGWSSGVSAQSLMLGMMPGGITELSLTAEALHLSVAMVTALQVLRLFLLMFLARPVFRYWLKRWPDNA
ncbi:AbrB family transcriptional regulator [Pseudomonas sp. 5P_3.1_Bac2]|uniref:AbrB family transcriptional regulator n=1 Tax=Pseudomonas sp. 5P_3.1_Bac2 TaxID=2971617 RepID=UPI0021C82087|nr:AbrB family transcriptional regulator [Pseudomonas sp. 5P_3.1_Bac2]MCU1715913.1 AbrB family transcriptional regulator [Pseudomonas sp. 5P_3.1_Bac2]